MDLKLHFLGAAQSVTGSSYLLETPDYKILVDCGYFQERDFIDRNWDPFEFNPADLDAVLLTHAHLDHCGLIPKLASEGFKGPIYCTPATASIAQIIVEDSARIQAEDMKYKIKRLKKDGRKPKHGTNPLYTVEDAQRCQNLWRKHPANECLDLGEGLEACFYEAGHILGACSIMVTVKQGDETRRILFSGDIGRDGAPILNDPHRFEEADYVITESTYGNRLHEPTEEIPEKFARIIHDTLKRGGNLIIPSFAVERSQDILYHLSNLLADKKIPPLMVFMDSPMAIKVTEVFKANKQLFDEETIEMLESGRHPVDFKGLTMTKSAAQSKAINQIRGSAIIIAGSGMCTGGRVKHHLRANIGRSEATVLFVGYQAKGTLGREILEGDDEVRIFGERHKIRARIEKINGFSGHADRDEMLEWLSSIKSPIKKVFITHGDKVVSFEYAQYIEEKLGVDAYVPKYQETVTLA